MLAAVEEVAALHVFVALRVRRVDAVRRDDHARGRERARGFVERELAAGCAERAERFRVADVRDEERDGEMRGIELVARGRSGGGRGGQGQSDECGSRKSSTFGVHDQYLQLAGSAAT